jgi:hypothetical protein
MTVEEGKKMIQDLKNEGFDEEQIVGGFYQLFIEDKVTLDQLGDLVQLVGYELTDEFRNMSPEDQKTKGWETEEDASSEVSEKENEDAKEYEPGEDSSKDSEKEESSSEEKENASSEDEKKDDAEDTEKEESEEEQEARAKKLFGL